MQPVRIPYSETDYVRAILNTITPTKTEIALIFVWLQAKPSGSKLSNKCLLSLSLFHFYLEVHHNHMDWESDDDCTHGSRKCPV